MSRPRTRRRFRRRRTPGTTNVPSPRCVYCGSFLRRLALTCGNHRDLPPLDPFYSA